MDDPYSRASCVFGISEDALIRAFEFELADGDSLTITGVAETYVGDSGPQNVEVLSSSQLSFDVDEGVTEPVENFNGFLICIVPPP